MYKSRNSITNSIWDLSNYIDNIDTYNAILLQELKRPDLTREQYEIKTYQYRPDLIAKDFYENEGYMGLILLQTGLTLTNFKRGVILNLIVKDELNKLLREIM